MQERPYGCKVKTMNAKYQRRRRTWKQIWSPFCTLSQLQQLPPRHYVSTRRAAKNTYRVTYIKRLYRHNYKYNPRPNIFFSACWQLFSIAASTSYTPQLSNYLSDKRAFISQNMCITFFPNTCLRKDGARRVRLIWTEIYVQIPTYLAVSFPLSRDIGICMSWPLSYVTNYKSV